MAFEGFFVSDRYFVDTSVWISYFRDAHFVLGDFLDSLIQDDRVAVDGIVLTELLAGAKKTGESELLAATLGGLRFLDAPRGFFERAGVYGRRLKSAAISVPLSDLFIATHCLEFDLVLIENDSHFEAVARCLPLRRYRTARGAGSRPAGRN